MTVGDVFGPIVIAIALFVMMVGAVGVDRKLNPQYWPDPDAPSCVCIIDEVKK